VIRSEAPVRTLRSSARPPQRYANYAPRFWPRICHMGKTAASTGIVPIVPMVPVAFEQCFPKAQGVIPVAILSTTDFDAATVDATSVRFGPKGALDSSPVTLQDVNRDGLADLVLHFRSEQAGIACGDTSAALTGRSDIGQTFVGQEDIVTVGCD